MRGIFANRWWIVVATICGLIVGGGIAGVGLGVALVPQLAAALIAAFGWRTAYLGLGAAVLVIAFVPVAIFLREPPHASQSERRAATAGLPGVDSAAAFRSGLF